MENRKTETATKERSFSEYPDDFGEDKLVRQRLAWLTRENEETERARLRGGQASDEFEAAAMKTPLSLRNAFSYFGLMLGFFPPAAFFARFGMEKSIEGWIIGVMMIMVLISTIVGYFSGRVAGKFAGLLEERSWLGMLLLAPFIGLLWGIVTGSAAGVIFFGIGALPGAFLGGLVGATAFPVFTALHRLVKKGEDIELGHFLPLALGVTFVICGLILSL